jgi:hypothetical protein
MSTTYDLKTQADTYRREAKRDYYAASRDAKRAASFYRTARQVEQHAAWLTSRPHVATPEYDYSPATLDAEARAWVSIADTFLRSSFRATDRARFHTGLARRYDEMAAKRAEWLATA